MTLQDSLDLKLRLERRLIRELRAFCKGYVKALDQAYKSNQLIDKYAVRSRLQQVLAHHYARVIRSVQTGTYFDTDESLTDIVDGQRAARLLEKARWQADTILGRIEADLKEVADVKSSGRELEVKQQRKPPFTTHLNIGLFALWRRISRRFPIWSNVNTQDVAEEQRWMDANSIPLSDQTIPMYDPGEKLWNRWVSMEDGKVRPTHQVAHGQTVPVEQPYQVGGHQLRYPGDTGLGAPLSEVVNCRCVSQAGVIRDGKFVPIEGFATDRGEAVPTVGPAAAARRLGLNKPTSMFTFGVGKGPWRGKIVVDNQLANYTVKPGGVVIRINRKPVASAKLTLNRDGTFRLQEPITIDPGISDPDYLRGTIRRSVSASNRLITQQPR